MVTQLLMSIDVPSYLAVLYRHKTSHIVNSLAYHVALACSNLALLFAVVV